MTQARSQYHHGDLRAELVSIGLARVDAVGAGQLSLRACTREAGVDVAAVYRHFRDKAELLAAVAARGFDELALEMERAGDTLVEVGQGYVRYGRRHPHRYRLMFGGEVLPKRVRHHTTRSPGAYELLERSLASIPQKERERAARFAWSVVHGFVSLDIDGRIHTRRGSLRQLLETAERALLG